MEALKALNQKIKEEGMVLQPCDYFHDCMEHVELRGNL